METVIQVLNSTLLKEALKTSTRKIRFGSEFCMYAIPTLLELEKAYEAVLNAGKEFSYITPRLADAPMKIIQNQLIKLNEIGESVIVINDLGTLKLLERYDNLIPQLGRQLIYTPSRCPWKEITESPVSIFTKRKVEKIFYQTTLNYEPTIDFYKTHGVVAADIDWIPQIFSTLKKIVNKGINISAHLFNIPIAITRKCHMARFLGEKDLNTCKRPCYQEAYYMKNETLGNEYYLHGNTVFRRLEPNESNMRNLRKQGIAEIIISMNPLDNELCTAEEAEKKIQSIKKHLIQS